MFLFAWAIDFFCWNRSQDTGAEEKRRKLLKQAMSTGNLSQSIKQQASLWQVYAYYGSHVIPNQLFVFFRVSNADG